MSYGNGQAPASALVDFEGHPASPDMAARLSVAIPRIRARGVSITINQIYRYLGVPADRAIGASDYSANEAKASQTSTGDGNQYYQAGRAVSVPNLVPSAATPGYSNHGDWGVGAVDSDTNNMAVRSEEFAAVGLTNTISLESWHAAATGAFTPSEDDMPLSEEDFARIQQITHDQIISVLRSDEVRDQILADSVNRAFDQTFHSGFVKDEAGAGIPVTLRVLADSTNARTGDIINDVNQLPKA